MRLTSELTCGYIAVHGTISHAVHTLPFLIVGPRDVHTCIHGVTRCGDYEPTVDVGYACELAIETLHVP
jgi:hypothetical protein